jgi:hypothetical protein
MTFWALLRAIYGFKAQYPRYRDTGPGWSPISWKYPKIVRKWVISGSKQGLNQVKSALIWPQSHPIVIPNKIFHPKNRPKFDPKKWYFRGGHSPLGAWAGTSARVEKRAQNGGKSWITLSIRRVGGQKVTEMCGNVCNTFWLSFGHHLAG